VLVFAFFFVCFLFFLNKILIKHIVWDLFIHLLLSEALGDRQIDELMLSSPLPVQKGKKKKNNIQKEGCAELPSPELGLKEINCYVSYDQ